METFRVFEHVQNSQTIRDVLLNIMNSLAEWNGFDEYTVSVESIIHRLDEYARFLLQYNSIRKIENDFKILNLREFLISEGIHATINLRIKSLYSLFQKINKNLAEKRSLWAIRDIIGIEIVPENCDNNDYDSEVSISELYSIANKTLSLFGQKYRCFLANKLPLRNTANFYDIETISLLKEMNPHIYIPSKSEIWDKYQHNVKDYVMHPKISTAYQGIHSVVVLPNGFEMEVQFRTESMRKYLNDSLAPGFHVNHKREKYSSITEIFDLSFNPDELKGIQGFDPNPNKDHSMLIGPQKYSWII